MKYTKQEVMQFIYEEDVKFIRLAFCDVFGKQKNISIMPYELERAFSKGVSIDASAIRGFGGEMRSDLFLHPDPDTLAILPWRPEHGKVVRMFCTITYPDGQIFENDCRSILMRAVEDAKAAGYTFYFGPEMEFYLFEQDENGNKTARPYDQAGYMDIAPEDKGENVRREICLMLEQMGIHPESSHHEAGPGQNEVDFRYADALSAADNAMAYYTVVNAVAVRNGLSADFSPKPIQDKPGNGLHINLSVKSADGSSVLESAVAGVLEHASAMTVFMNPTAESYQRLGSFKAPQYISWGCENRSLLVRLPAADDEHRRAELRSPDPTANPYLAFALLIYAGLDGIKRQLQLPPAAEINFFAAEDAETQTFEKLPSSLKEAAAIAQNSTFIAEHLPKKTIDTYCG